jgi:DNA-binding protein H-NS
MMDLSNMSLGDLRNLQEQIKQEMKQREQQEVQKAREQIMAIAQSVGVPLKDLISASGRGGKAGANRARVRSPSVSVIRTMNPSSGPAAAASRNGSRNGSKAVNRWTNCASDSAPPPPESAAADSHGASFPQKIAALSVPSAHSACASHCAAHGQSFPSVVLAITMSALLSNIR